MIHVNFQLSIKFLYKIKLNHNKTRNLVAGTYLFFNTIVDILGSGTRPSLCKFWLPSQTYHPSLHHYCSSKRNDQRDKFTA